MTIANGWAVAKLGEIAHIQLGKMLSDKARSPELMERPYLRNENVRWWHIDFASVKSMGFKPNELERYGVMPGDLLVCEGGEPGRCAVYNGPPGQFMYQKALHRVRSRTDAFSPHLLQYWLRYLADSGALASRIAQTTIQHLPLERFSEVELSVPPRPEQQRIVAIIEQHFSDIDAGVAALERALANLKRYRAAVLKAACEGKLVPTEAELARKANRDYEPADVLLKRILAERRFRWEADQLAKMATKGQTPKDDGWKARYQEPNEPETAQLPMPPEGWKWTTVDVVGDLLLGRRRAPEYTGALRSYLRVANIKDDRIDFSDVLTMPFEDGEFHRYRLESGDILLSEGQSPELVGRSAIFYGELLNVGFQATLHRFRPTRSGPGSKFAQLVFRAHVYLGAFRPYASITTNIAHLTLEKLRVVPFPLPPLAEQHRIVAEVDRLLSNADETEQTLRAQLARASRLRQAVLKRAFEGKLVPQDPTDEPATALLARLRAENASAPKPTSRPRKR